MNIGCGDVGQFNLTEEDYFYGRYSFPWTVTILKHRSPLVHCLGILIQSADIQHASNWTQFVLTSSQCFGYNNNDSERKKKLFYVFVGKYNPRNVSEMIKNSLKIEDIKEYKDSTSTPHITLLKLKTPVILHKNRHPVCLIKTKKLHVAQKCFVSGYNMKKNVVAEYPASLIFEFPCTKDSFRVLQNKKGLCSEVKQLQNVKHDGAGLTCFVNGKAYLYGIFYRSFFALTRDRIYQPLTVLDMLLPKKVKMYPLRLPDMIAFFAGFQPTVSGKAAAVLIRIHTVNVREIGNGNLGFLILEMSKSISKRENGTSYPRRARRKEHINGVDSCHTTGLDEDGFVQYNKVDIVTPIACEQFFGNKFDRNFMICVTEENSPITHSVGAPLICKKNNVEITFGIKLALSAEYENKNENNATASAYLSIAEVQ
ncbi:hypothetical protein D917_06074 [Trichinella nativa]|uniref:Peptidase S1 domain-containing protein n=1 Tax=Trichinella nativa TaxID=6335 RepID=A0A1Y3ETR6_9BILA|nr:hypothetical protein D917_06074 [Trichinella nativa]